METLMMECVSRYCAIKGRTCEIEVPGIPERSCFVAYPFEQPFADIATFLDDKLSNRGYRMEVPRASRSATGLLFCNFICPMILRSRSVIGEVTDPNRNVFFELGYAYGLGKEVYLVRNTGLERKSNPILESGIYVHHYGAPEELIDSFTGRESKLRPMLFDEPMGETVPGSVAVLIPDHSHHQSVIGDAIHACVQANNLVPAAEATDGIALLRQYRLIRAAEWTLGDLVSDEAVGSQDLNCETAFLLGVSLALGKKMVIVQEAPVAKPMIDLAGLLEVYHGVEDLTRILTRKLDVQADRAVRRIERSDGPVDGDTERRQLSRAEIGPADDESIFAEMTPNIPADLAFKTSKATEPAAAEPPPSQDMGEPDLAKRVKEIIAENLGVQESEVRNRTRLEADLGADELDETEILMALEEEFGVEITDEEADAAGLGSFLDDDVGSSIDPTVAGLINLVARKVAE